MVEPHGLNYLKTVENLIRRRVLGLLCLSVTLLWVSRLQWVKLNLAMRTEQIQFCLVIVVLVQILTLPGTPGHMEAAANVLYACICTALLLSPMRTWCHFWCYQALPDPSGVRIHDLPLASREYLSLGHPACIYVSFNDFKFYWYWIKQISYDTVLFTITSVSSYISIRKQSYIVLKLLHARFRPCQGKKFLWTCAKCADSHHLAHAQSLIRHLIYIETFFSIQRHCLRTEKALIRQSDLGLRCPHMPGDTFSHGAVGFVLTFWKDGSLRIQ